MNPVSYTQIINLDRQLDRLESEIPPVYRFSSLNSFSHQADPLRALRTLTIQLSICQERLRLHRPFLVRAYANETCAPSRRASLTSARMVLEIQGNPLFLKAPWAGVIFKAVQSSIVLCIDLLHFPNGPEAQISRRSVDGALQRFDMFSEQSVSSFAESTLTQGSC